MLTLLLLSNLFTYTLYKPASFYASGLASFVDSQSPESVLESPSSLKYIDTANDTFYINAQLISSLGLNDYVNVFFGNDPNGKLASEQDLLALAGSNKYLRLANSILYTYSNSLAFSLQALWTSNSSFSLESPIQIDMFSSYDINLGMIYDFELFSLNFAIAPNLTYRSAIFGILSSTDLSSEGILPSLGTSNSCLFITTDLAVSKKLRNVIYALTFKNIGAKVPVQETESLPLLPSSATLSLTTEYPLGTTSLSGFIALNKYLNYTESSMLNILRFGMNFALNNTLFLRAGFANTSYTVGVSVRYWLLQISFASFLDDSLMYATNSDFVWDKNRRYVLEVTLHF